MRIGCDPIIRPDTVEIPPTSPFEDYLVIA
jgi:hypothetical protein